MYSSEFDIGLFPAVLNEAKGHVLFFDISFIEAMPRYAKSKNAQDKLTLQIELTNFSVYYTQGAGDAVENQLKEGKSAVVCEQGQLIKIIKDKQGLITRERLTKTWTGWVDYGAVDFDYQSRREIIKVAVESEEMAIEDLTPSPQPSPAGERGN